jgi:hypothetical protein
VPADHDNSFIKSGDAVVCETYTYLGDEQFERANAAFIVRAVNCHDDLVSALEASNKLITAAQEKLCAYLHPDSSIDDAQIANLMLEHFDGPTQREVQKKTREALARASGEKS